MAGTAGARLLDWDAAARIGGRLAGRGPEVTRAARAEVEADFTELVLRAEDLVTGFTGLATGGPPTRSWVMSRADWVERNVAGFSALVDPIAERILRARPEGPMAAVRRTALAAQVGALLGYLGRKVLGQYDVFAGRDDLLYFVGPNVVEVERRFRFSPRDFRLWLCLHEVTHRVQFGGVPWLRGYIRQQIDDYLRSVDLDGRQLVDTVRRAVEEARSSSQWRGLGVLFLLMTEEQREIFRRMQAVMSLLEGHANFVMERMAPGAVRGHDRMRRTLQRRRHGRPVDRMVQRTLGFEAKVRQYDLGERFCRRVDELVGMDGLGRVWEGPDRLPTLEEIADPDAWAARVAGG